MGKNTKIVTIETTPKIELTTNTSPLIAPRAAIPWVNINKKDDATINAPYPIPYCLSSRSPNNNLAHSKFQPLMPIEKPCIISQLNPIAPAKINTLP